MYLRPRPLEREDVLEEFDSQSPEQTLWLREHARQAHAARSAHVMVVTEPDSHAVVAYYAWTMASVEPATAPTRVARGAGGHPQPFALLARLAVHRDHEGRGLGHALLADSVLRTIAVSSEIGCRGLLLHAENDNAREFYLHALPGFESAPTSPLHLMALTKDLRKSIGTA